MTAKQKKVVAEIIKMKSPIFVVHGDCEGADTDFHNICLPLFPIRIRPCNHKSRAWNDGASDVMNVKSPLERNKDIVRDSNLLVAAPPTSEEIKRSGTWHTIRHARKMNVPKVIVWPDGSLTIEK
jgi:hypothetical protein